MNVVVLQGVLARPAELRTLPSGDVLAALELTTRDPDGVALTVPVVWGAVTEEQMASLEAGAEIAVLGVVRRRFFRAGGATQSRTEVVADLVVPAHDRRKARRLVDLAAKRL
ncbi:MAG TPA: hypothetical protein VF855_02845 [Acidimicrobiales bacterium]